MNAMDRDTVISFLKRNGLDGNVLRHKRTGRMYVYLDKAVDAGNKGRTVWILRAIPSWRLLVMDEETGDTGDFERTLNDEAIAAIVDGLTKYGRI